ncbi:hypothetical protein ACXVUM_09410 [Williamsia sp. SKLECPSW1]
MTDPDEPSVLRDTGVTTTVPDDVWSRALSVAFDPDAQSSDASVVPVMDDSGDLPDTSSGEADPGILHQPEHDPGGHDGAAHGAIDLGDGDHDAIHHDDAHGSDHGHDDGHGDGHGHDSHDSGWHV